MSKILDSDALRVLQHLLTDALNSARMTSAGFGFPNDRVIAASIHGGEEPATNIKEGAVVHPTRYIVEMTRSYRQSWIISPIARAMEALGLPVPVAPTDTAAAHLPIEDGHRFYIRKTWPEVQSGLDRVRLAGLLIAQLPENHDGRNTWLMHYGSPEVAEPLRAAWSERTGRPWGDGTVMDAAKSETVQIAVGAGQVVDAEFVPPTPHPHADVLAQWLKDTTRPLWFWDVHSAPGPKWSILDGHNLITMGAGYHVAIGDKPSSPPRRMCMLAGVEFPAPETEAPEADALCWFPTMKEGEILAMFKGWQDTDADQFRLANGLIHKTEDAAVAHARALLAATKQAIEAAK